MLISGNPDLRLPGVQQVANRHLAAVSVQREASHVQEQRGLSLKLKATDDN